MTQRFLHQFSINHKYPKTAAYLFSIVQREGEPLRDYIRHFVEVVYEVPHVNYELLVGIMQQNHRHGKFKESITGKPPFTLEKLLARAENYIRIKEAASLGFSGKKKQGEEERPMERKKEERKCVPPTEFTHFANVQESHLAEYVDKSKADRGERRQPGPAKDYDTAKEQVEELSQLYSGGPMSGDSRSSRRTLLGATNGTHSISSHSMEQVFHLQSPREELSFSNLDLEEPREAHNNALVISATMSNFWVKKILVDSGSSTGIMFHDAGDVVEALEEITLPVSLGSYPKRATRMVKFLVVKSFSTYNIILGRSSMNLFRVVVSTYHMKLKFPTPEGVGEAIGDKRLARVCFAETLCRTQNNGKSQEGGSMPRSIAK
ncbi:hypothetical protein Pfo_005342 [Paulownia fortunei]|nr:hypothetical protein Pfo_005342 [Paulownia fortunei]